MSAALLERAAARLPDLLSNPGLRIASTLGPIHLSARVLAGTSPIFWASALREVRSLEIPVSHASDGLIAFHSAPGALIVSLSGVAGYAFYVECMIRTPDPATLMHWDATMAPDPVSGVMTRVGHGDDHHFFATPFTIDREVSHLQVSQHSPATSPDEHWTLKEMTLLGFTM